MAALVHRVDETPTTRWVSVADHRAEVLHLQRVARQLLAKVAERAASPEFTSEEISVIIATATNTEDGE